MDHSSPIEGFAVAGHRGPRLTTAGLYSAIAVGFVGALFIFITPVMLALMGQQGRLDDTHLGYVAAWDINAMALAIGASTFMLVTVPWRRAVSMALVLIMAGNLAAAFAHSYVAIATACCVAGLGEGLAVGFSFAALGRANNPDRAFAIYLVVGALLGSVLLYMLPLIQTMVTPRALFLANVALTGVVALGIPAFPDGHDEEDQVYTGQRVNWRMAVTGLSAVFLVFFAIGAVWSYAERIAEASHLSAQTISRGLSVGTLAGVVGAGVAGFLPRGWPRVVPLLFGTVSVVAGFTLLKGQVGPTIYLAAIVLVLFGWNFMQPLLSGLCSDADSRGRVVCAMGSIQTFGMGFGPALAGPMIIAGSFDAPIRMASGAMVAGVGCIAAEVALRRRRHHA